MIPVAVSGLNLLGVNTEVAARAAAAAGDPYWANVSLLLPGNGTNGAQNNTFTDASTNNFTITRNGNTTQGTFSPFTAAAPYNAMTKGGSGYFDGTGDYLSVADNAALDVGSSDFTLETWYYPLANPSSDTGIIAKRATAGSFDGILIIIGGLDYKPAAYATVNGSSFDVTITAASAITLNAWTHLAFTRSGNTWTLWVNGVSQGTNTVSGTVPDNSAAFTVGAGSADGSRVTPAAYFAGTRLVKGTAVYTANFTPPTAPLTAITNTQLLLNFTNAGIIDNAMLNDLETVGNAQISTAQSKFGGSSILFDETDDYLTVPPSPNMSLGTGDFTIECWVRFAVSTIGNGQGVFQLSNGYLNSAVRGPALGVENASGEWTIYYGTTFAQAAGNVPAINTWHHAAVVRSSGTTKLYVNGTSIISVADTTNYTDQHFTIGGWYSTGFLLNGYIDDLRITKGVARYTANFTPPVAAFPLR